MSHWLGIVFYVLTFFAALVAFINLMLGGSSGSDCARRSERAMWQSAACAVAFWVIGYALRLT